VETDIHHHGQTDDLGARLEVAKRAAFCHPETLIAHPARLNRFCSDSAVTRPIRICRHLLDTFTADFSGKHRAKSIPPVQHNFMANVDPMLVPQVIDIAQRKWKSNVHYAHQADDLGAAVKVLEGVCFGHQRRLRNRPTRLKQILF
jgi:hypothetical protein